ncbi:MAG TPA: DNA-3-methyladenine glycosylase I [Bacteroidota bacterium]|nr:DNA-3-methyladenine glycosylase I [Bacteroidota bacterium]
MNDTLIRCPWCGSDPLYMRYHDEEWGVPQYDERILFEMLILEGAQAGLSWLTVLRKRENYRAAFEQFDPVRVAAFDETRMAALLDNPSIIRNRLKIAATVRNARAWLALAEAEGRSPAAWLWDFVDGRPVRNTWEALSGLPARTPQSDAMSKELKRRGFTFVGSTICYAFMQAVGMVNDHLVSCHRHAALS